MCRLDWECCWLGGLLSAKSSRRRQASLGHNRLLGHGYGMYNEPLTAQLPRDITLLSGSGHDLTFH